MLTPEDLVRIQNVFHKGLEPIHRSLDGLEKRLDSFEKRLVRLEKKMNTSISYFDTLTTKHHQRLHTLKKFRELW